MKAHHFIDPHLLAGTADLAGEGKRYPCKCDPDESWNGWSIPVFTMAVFHEILKDTGWKITGHTQTAIIIEHPDQSGADEVEAYGGYVRFSGWIWDFYPDTNKEQAS